jgi:hypothetical protein
MVFKPGTAWKGQAPEGHPHQCVATARGTGLRCRRFAVNGGTRCINHNGRQDKHNRRKRYIVGRLPVWYRKVLNVNLAKFVEEQTEQARAVQVEVFDELALFRAEAVRSVALYSAADSLQDDNPKKGALLESAGALMRERLEQVVKVAETAARIYNAGKDKLSAGNLQGVVDQITLIAYEVLQDQPDKAAEFANLIRTKLTVQDAVEGTSLTPDQDALDMDGTVPRRPVEDPLEKEEDFGTHTFEDDYPNQG